MRLFHKDGDYEAFERVLVEGFSRYPVDLRPAGPPIHPPRSRLAAEEAKQSVMSPFSSLIGFAEERRTIDAAQLEAVCHELVAVVPD